MSHKLKVKSKLIKNIGKLFPLFFIDKKRIALSCMSELSPTLANQWNSFFIHLDYEMFGWAGILVWSNLVQTNPDMSNNRPSIYLC